MHRIHFLTFAAALAALIALCSPQTWAVPYSFTESLAADPFSTSGGNFSVSAASGLSPDTYAQFTWDAATPSKYAGDAAGSLVVVYDSSKPAVRLERTLPLTLGMDRSFSLAASMTVHSQDLAAPATDIFEMTFALTNQALTGGNRTGSATDGADVYHNVEFSYYPNVASWGGPTLQVVAFGEELSGTGVDAFSNFATPDFDEGDLGDNVAGQITTLPLDTPLDVTLSYDAITQIVTLAVSLIESDGSLTQLLLSDTGVIDIDLSAAGSYGWNTYDNTAPFSLDSLAITSYFDHWAITSPSLYAVVEYDGFTFEASEVIPEPASMMLLGLGVLALLRRRRT